MQICAPAKINLTLRVLGKRPDGYHDLESIMQMITLSDTLTIESDEALHFSCSDPSLENDENLVVHAARLLLPYNKIPRGARIHLAKHIPSQAGLGGGSSDAATALLALNELWEIRLPLDDLAVMAATLGSDVPFFLYTSTAIVRGRGESITPVPHAAQCHLVLAKPTRGLSTRKVYGDLHAPAFHPGKSTHILPETRAMISALDRHSAEDIASALANDLEGPALPKLPELFHIRERMLDLGALGVLLCGSGSALFGIWPNEQTASHAAIDLSNDCPWTATAMFYNTHTICP